MAEGRVRPQSGPEDLGCHGTYAEIEENPKLGKGDEEGMVSVPKGRLKGRSE